MAPDFDDIPEYEGKRRVPTPRIQTDPGLARVSTVARAAGTGRGVQPRTMRRWLEAAGIEILVPHPSRRLQFVRIRDVLDKKIVTEERLEMAMEFQRTFYMED